MKNRNPEYDEALRLVSEHETDAANEAIDAFDKATAELFKTDGAYMIGVITKKAEAAKKGMPVYPFSDAQAEKLSKLLSAKTCVYFKSWDIDTDKDESDMSLDADDYIDKSYTGIVSTEATDVQGVIVGSLISYATAGIALAKSINSRSADNWALIVDILRQLKIVKSYFRELDNDNCAKLIENEQIAANRLRLDLIIVGVEPYKATKQAKESPKKAAH